MENEQNILRVSYLRGNMAEEQALYGMRAVMDLLKIKGKKAQEKPLLEQLSSGSRKIILHREKLKGEFALVKIHGMGKNVI